MRLVLLAFPALASAGPLDVVVANVASDQGSVVVWVYDSPDAWLSGDEVFRVAGLSNNAVPRFGPPKYRDARFTLGDGPAEQRIRLD